MTELLLGCGSSREKRLSRTKDTGWSDLTTLDINPDHKPDVVWDLHLLPLPFADNHFDEIHAYEVLEHVGQQGDYRTFFNQFCEFWRILKPNGHMFVTVPSRLSPWAWGDPSHTRIIQKEHLVFLVQSQYTEQVGKTPMSDFRHIYKADFDVEYVDEGPDLFSFVIKAVKPSRIK